MLDDYIKRHVHGVVRIHRDVEAMFLIPVTGAPRSSTTTARSVLVGNDTKGAIPL
jgi:hypothetical protein